MGRQQSPGRSRGRGLRRSVCGVAGRSESGPRRTCAHPRRRSRLRHRRSSRYRGRASSSDRRLARPRGSTHCRLDWPRRCGRQPPHPARPRHPPPGLLPSDQLRVPAASADRAAIGKSMSSVPTAWSNRPLFNPRGFAAVPGPAWPRPATFQAIRHRAQARSSVGVRPPSSILARSLARQRRPRLMGCIAEETALHLDVGVDLRQARSSASTKALELDRDLIKREIDPCAAAGSIARAAASRMIDAHARHETPGQPCADHHHQPLRKAEGHHKKVGKILRPTNDLRTWPPKWTCAPPIIITRSDGPHGMTARQNVEFWSSVLRTEKPIGPL